MAPGKRSSLVGVAPMPIIAEEAHGNIASFQWTVPAAPTPQTPARAFNPSAGYSSPNARGLNRPTLIGLARNKAPWPAPPPYYAPPYSKEGPNEADRSSNGTKKASLRDIEWTGRRGGRFRLCLTLGLLSALVVGIAVGLTIGLKNR